MNKLNQHLIEELSNLEEVIEKKTYDAVFTGISKAMKDLGFNALEGGAIDVSPKPVTKEREAPSSTEEDGGDTMTVTARGRKGRSSTPKDVPSPLTRTQRQVMKSIQNYIDAHGKSPTYSELSKELDKSGVATIVYALETKGWIDLDEDKYSRKIEMIHRI